MIEQDGRIGLQLKALSNLINRYFANAAACDHNQKEFTSTQVAVLMFLHKREALGDHPVFQKDVEAALDVRSPTATSILQTLEKRGFIYREAVEGDMRLKRVALTMQARERHKRQEQIASELDCLLVKDVSVEDLAVFNRVVHHATQNIRQYLKNEKTE